jgi:hypothetical protein
MRRRLFNGALSLHKWGYPKEAVNFLYYEKKYANRNANILQSDLVNQYVPILPKTHK